MKYSAHRKKTSVHTHTHNINVSFGRGEKEEKKAAPKQCFVVRVSLPIFCLFLGDAKICLAMQTNNRNQCCCWYGVKDDSVLPAKAYEGGGRRNKNTSLFLYGLSRRGMTREVFPPPTMTSATKRKLTCYTFRALVFFFACVVGVRKLFLFCFISSNLSSIQRVCVLLALFRTVNKHPNDDVGETTSSAELSVRGVLFCVPFSREFHPTPPPFHATKNRVTNRVGGCEI